MYISQVHKNLQKKDNLGKISKFQERTYEIKKQVAVYSKDSSSHCESQPSTSTAAEVETCRPTKNIWDPNNSGQCPYPVSNSERERNVREAPPKGDLVIVEHEQYVDCLLYTSRCV